MKKFLVMFFGLMLIALMVGCVGVTPNYEVVFKDGETVLKTQSVTEGELLEKPADPTKAATEQYEYAFDGWYNGRTKWNFETDKVKSNLTLTAQYTEQIRSYTVTFQDADGTKLQDVKVEYGSVVSAPTNPEKTATAQHEFTFEGWYVGEDKWDFATTIKSDITLKAKYNETLRSYTVKFVNEDGSLLKEEVLDYGEMPTAPADPTKAETLEATYEFVGWDKEIAAVVGETVYQATYRANTKSYAITFKMDDGTVIETVNFPYGQVPNCSVEPTKEEDGFVYVFKGWDKDIAAVTGEAVYQAVFEKYVVGLGNTETFEENIYLNNEKYISGYYNYSSTSKSVAPIVIVDGKLTFNVLEPTGYQGLSIDFGSVKAGKSYLISLDVEMLKEDGSACLDGFAYALTSLEGATASSAGGILVSFTLLAKQGEFVYLYTPTEDLDNLYLVIRCQKDKGYVNSQVIIDNVCCEETTIEVRDTNSIASGSLAADFAEGIVVAEGKGARYHGDITVYTPNLNSGLQYIKGEKPVLRFNHLIETQRGLYGIKVEDIVAGNMYEVVMDIDMFDAAGNNVNASVDTYFEAMVYFNNAFENNRYQLIDINGEKCGVNVPLQKLTVEGNTVKFSFAAVENGYVMVSLRSASGKGLIYAEISSFEMTTLETVKVEFVDADGTVLQSSGLVKGDVPAYNGEEPTKASDGEYNYKFAGWSLDGQTLITEFTALTEATTYQAVYTKEAIEYSATINFDYAEEAQVIKFTTLTKESALAAILALVPANDAQYTYTSDIPASLELANKEYTISRSVNKYTVVFKYAEADGGTEIESKELEYGVMPVCAIVPTKANFSFVGWEPAVVSVVGDATYVAVFEELQAYYDAIFQNDDGSELYKVNLAANTVPTYSGEEPTKAADSEYSYKFAGWSLDGLTVLPELPELTATTVFVAVFTKQAIEYTVTFYDENDQIISEIQIEFGSQVELIDVPTKAGYTGSWVGQTYETMPAQNISYKASYVVATYQATIEYGAGFGEMDSVVVEFTQENRAEKLAEIAKLAESKDIRFTYSWANALPQELPLDNTSFTLVRTFDQNVETFDGDITRDTATKTLNGAKWVLNYLSSIMPLSVTGSYHTANGSGKTLLWQLASTTGYGTMNINMGSVVAGVKYTVIFDMLACEASSSTGGDVPDTPDFETTLTALAFGEGAKVSASSNDVHFALVKNGVVTLEFTPTASADNYYLVFRSQKSTAAWVLIDNLYIKGETTETPEEPEETLLSLTETFEAGSVDANGANYTGGTINAKRPNSNSSLAIVDYNNSKALAITRDASTAKSTGYVGFYMEIESYTTYMVSLDLAVVGSTTADLSSSELILFEVYENNSIGQQTSRLILYSTVGRWLNNNQRISSFNPTNGTYNVVFTTSNTGSDGYIYFTLRLNGTLTETATAYVDNLKIQEFPTVVSDDFENGTAANNVYNGNVSAIRPNSYSTISVGTYNSSKMLQTECVASQGGYVGIKVEVEGGKTYQAIFDYYLVGESGTSYVAGSATGNSASLMIAANTTSFGDSAARIKYVVKGGGSTTNTTLVNLLSVGNRYLTTFTPSADGYVYLILKTNSIPEVSTIYVDNLHVACLSLD